MYFGGYRQGFFASRQINPVHDKFHKFCQECIWFFLKKFFILKWVWYEWEPVAVPAMHLYPNQRKRDPIDAYE